MQIQDIVLLLLQEPVLQLLDVQGNTDHLLLLLFLASGEPPGLAGAEILPVVTWYIYGQPAVSLQTEKEKLFFKKIHV